MDAVFASLCGQWTDKIRMDVEKVSESWSLPHPPAPPPPQKTHQNTEHQPEQNRSGVAGVYFRPMPFR